MLSGTLAEDPLAVDLASNPHHLSGVLSQRVKPDEPTTVLLHPQTGEYYTLDEIGSRVWELCDGARTVAEIAASIAREYDAPASEVERDVLELLNDLEAEQLLANS